MGGWKRDLKKKRLEARISDFEAMMKTIRGGNDKAYKKPGSQKR